MPRTFELGLEGWESVGHKKKVSGLIKPTMHKLHIVWTKVMDFPPRTAPQKRKSCLIFKSCKFPHVMGFSFHCFILKNHISLKGPKSRLVFSSYRRSQRQFRNYSFRCVFTVATVRICLHAPFRHHAAQHWGYTVKVMNIHKSTNTRRKKKPSYHGRWT